MNRATFNAFAGAAFNAAPVVVSVGPSIPLPMAAGSVLVAGHADPFANADPNRARFAPG